MRGKGSPRPLPSSTWWKGATEEEFVKHIPHYGLRFLDRSVAILAYVAALAILALIGIVSYSVLMRYLFHRPISETIIMSQVIGMLVLYLPLALGLKEQAHPTITTITDRLSSRKQSIMFLVNLVFMVALCSLWTASFWRDMASNFEMGITVDLVDWLQEGWIRIPMILGMACMTLLALAYIPLTVRNLMQGKPVDYSPSLSLRSLEKPTDRLGGEL